MARLELDRIVKRYENGFEAVQAFSIDIASGEFIVLVGPSGCGKSTTLRMVAGLESITEGELRLDGERINERPPKARQMAMVFQSYALYPHMTVAENLSFALRLQRVPKTEIDAQVRAVAERLDIAALLDRKPKALSGGQRQRVAIGRAIMRAPRIFLFDEPLSNLDARLRLHMRVEISKLHRQQGTTSLYVTHDQVEAMTLADRMVLLKDGIVQQIGPPLELYERPKNRFVAGFLGSPSMNFLPAQIADGAAQVAGARWALPTGAQLTTGQAVELGLRPEHFQLCDALADDPQRIAGQVELVEPMGSESYIHVNSAAGPLVVRAPGAVRPQIGETVHLRPDLQKLHLFDARSEVRL